MRIIPISEILQMEANETVMAVAGIVDSVFESNSGTNEHGDWTIQNIVLKDATDPKIKIKVKVSDREPLPMNYKGKALWISCTQNSKGVWCGLKVKDDTYKGKTSKILSCTATANISFHDPTTGQEPEPEQPQETAIAKSNREAGYTTDPTPAHQQPARAPHGPTPHDSTKSTPTTTHAPAPAAPVDDKATAVAKSRKALGSAANSYWLCLLAGEHVFKKYRERMGEPMTSEQFQSMVSTFFIHIDRQGLVGSLPPGDISAYMPQPKPSDQQP